MDPGVQCWGRVPGTISQDPDAQFIQYTRNAILITLLLVVFIVAMLILLINKTNHGSTWTPKVCRILAFWAIFRGFGPLFYLPWGFR